LTNPLLRFDTLDSWLAWQEKLHFTEIELGLDRCRKVALSMRLLPPTFFVISIAGTNGKGSCAVLLETILRAAGYKVGLYTSPHLIRYNERIRINGVEADDWELCQAFNRIDEARETTSLTYFEFGTLAAIDLFQRHQVDIAVMEVGLGGRLDAVNMLDADVALISTIDIDHQQWLGSNRNAIGREKAGIFRPMRPAVCADPDPPTSLVETANLVGANLLRSGHEFFHETAAASWSWRSGLIEYNGLPIPGKQLWQIQNASGVMMVLEVIAEKYPVAKDTLLQSLRDFRMPGRSQLVPGKIPVILDVAHNDQSAATLADTIRALPKTGKIRLILGMLKDKDHKAFISRLLPSVDNWYLASLDGARGVSSQDLAEVIRASGDDADLQQFAQLEQAVDAARDDAIAGDQIIITGSFVTVGRAMKHIGVKI